VAEFEFDDRGRYHAENLFEVDAVGGCLDCLTFLSWAIQFTVGTAGSNSSFGSGSPGSLEWAIGLRRIPYDSLGRVCLGRVANVICVGFTLRFRRRRASFLAGRRAVSEGLRRFEFVGIIDEIIFQPYAFASFDWLNSEFGEFVTLARCGGVVAVRQSSLRLLGAAGFVSASACGIGIRSRCGELNPRIAWRGTVPRCLVGFVNRLDGPARPRIRLPPT